MAQLFSRRANLHYRATLVVLVLLIVGVPAALMAWARFPYSLGLHDAPEQPVPFDHRHHVRDDHIDCRYCHWTVERSPSAGLPASETCMNCHSQVFNDSPLLAPVRESVETGRPIPWQRVYKLPDFVFFDHSVHVAKGVGCETCHGRVDLMPRVAQDVSLTMGWCLQCHRNPQPYLRPLDEITTMGYSPADSGQAAPRRTSPMGDESNLGATPASLRNVHPPTNCTTCHR